MSRLLVLLTATMQFSAYGWGFFAHKKINETAVFTVPKPLFGFYKNHLIYLREHAPDPDKRRYVSESEACRHYMDCDRYEKAAPLDTISRTYDDACGMYSEDTLKAHGILPWHIQTMMYRLTEAFQTKNVKNILKYSADLGHYVGDLHVPLHACSNYNGQKTSQHGIHGLWESRLPELFFEGYNMFTGIGKFYESPADSIWKALNESFILSEQVLDMERIISGDFEGDRKYSFETRGSSVVKVYSEAFCNRYHQALGGMVENRMRASVIMLGSLWYTCWVNAGQPDLESMPLQEEEDDEPLSDPPPDAKMLGRDEHE